MIKKVVWLAVFLLTVSFISAESIYQQDSLELEFNIDGSIEFIPTGSGAKLKEASAELLLFPLEDYRQEILDINSEGILQDGSLNFFWNDQIIEKKEFGYSSIIDTNNARIKVKTKVPFPISEEKIQGLEDYLQITETIDSDNPEIIAKASELAEGEDDLFKVAFNLAEWVERNVNYDLNTLTATASQKASWVLENREGVCDEMTSLFIAMARSLGIPARFVSGISYTTSELFDYNWQPHGWAEVYFPGIGWVSFDITFGEFGYIDVTHIKLRDGFDPQEPAVRYNWIANEVELEKTPLDLKVEIKEEGVVIPEEILIEKEILSEEVGFGSYNLIKGIIKNTADYYTATTLQLSVPEEVNVEGRNRRTIMLHPKEVRETFWIVKVPANLNDVFIYTFPVYIYSEKNISVLSSFQAESGKSYYSKKDIKDLTVQDEEKSYSRRVSFQCDYPEEMKLREEDTITCEIKNSGNSNLENLDFCLGYLCEIIDLPINQKKSLQIIVEGEEAGLQRVIVSAENDLVEKKIPLEYSVLDIPRILVEPGYPSSVPFGDSFEISLTIKKESFSNPEQVRITLEGPGFDTSWDLNTLEKDQNLLLELEGTRLSSTNKFTVTASWKDKEGKEHREEKGIVIKGEANSLSDRIKMVLNSILNLFL